MPPALPLITLLTDFGTKDYFVASMKGVILTINPDARIIDISHDITPHRIVEAAYCLQSCYRTFPEGTVHVAVVDPGVGSARRPLVVKTTRYYFVVPDNGILTSILDEEPAVEIRQLENRQYQVESPGATFHGRDIFAPAAAWLIKGEAPASFGRLISDPVRLIQPKPVGDDRTICGRIVYVDRFGNLISDLTSQDLIDLSQVTNRLHPVIRIAGRTIEGVVESYSEGHAGMPGALVNSNGRLEVFLKEASAAGLLQVSAGESITIE